MKNNLIGKLLGLAVAMTLSTLGQANAVELQPLGKILISVLGTSKAFQKKIGDAIYYYSKDASGKIDRVAFIEKNTWQDSSIHTWIVGVGPNGRVTRVVAQERPTPDSESSAESS